MRWSCRFQTKQRITFIVLSLPLVIPGSTLCSRLTVKNIYRGYVEDVEKKQNTVIEGGFTVCMWYERTTSAVLWLELPEVTSLHRVDLQENEGRQLKMIYCCYNCVIRHKIELKACNFHFLAVYNNDTFGKGSTFIEKIQQTIRITRNRIMYTAFLGL